MSKVYTIRQQDCLCSIAADHGFYPDSIWDDAGNKELRERRPNRNTLLPGDELVIPDLRRKDVACATGGRHRFVRKGVPEMVKLVLRDEDGEPRADLPYTLTIDGVSWEGTTDGDGAIEHAIPPNAREGELAVGDYRLETYPLDLGGLDPIDTVSGAQQRLENLGHPCERLDGVLGEPTRAALREFQGAHELDVTGEYDDPTRSKLEEIHGS